MNNLSLSIAEIIILQSGAIVLGFVLQHFFISKKKPVPLHDKEQQVSIAMDMKMQHTQELDMKDRELRKLKEQLTDAEENNTIYLIEIEERSKELKKIKNQKENTAGETVQSNFELTQLKQELTEVKQDNKIFQIEIEEQLKELKKLRAELSNAAIKEIVIDNSAEIAQLKNQLSDAMGDKEIFQIEAEELRREVKLLKTNLEQASKISAPAVSSNISHYDQLQQAQQSLKQENERIGRLLDQIDMIKEKEEKEKEMLNEKEALYNELSGLKEMLNQKEKEMIAIQQKANLTREMTSMLDNAYSEFNILQDKMHKLEVQVTTSRMTSMELEDLKESYYRLNKDYEEQKIKLNISVSEKQQYFKELTETEEKLKEANFQRQQLQKKVAYLEELSRDMAAMADANKKLEVQIRRIGELESMLNVTEEERDRLKNQVKS